MAEQRKQAQEQDINQLLKVRRDKLKELQENGKDPFVITKYDVTHHSQEIKDRFDELEGQIVSVAGRVMSKRVMGKASFCNIQDLPGNIQSYVARDSVGEEAYKDFKKMDIGDIVGRHPAGLVQHHQHHSYGESEHQHCRESGHPVPELDGRPGADDGGSPRGPAEGHQRGG